MQLNLSVNSTIVDIPDGDAGIMETLEYMRKLARDGSVTPEIRETAISVCAHLPNKDYIGECDAIRTFVSSNIRYVRDVEDVETIQTPSCTLRIRAGDCDDHAILLSSLLISIGFVCRLVALDFGNGFQHVIAQALVDGEFISCETTEEVCLGWIPENVVRTMELIC